MNIDNNDKYELGFSARKITQKTVNKLPDKIQNIIDNLDPDSKKAAIQLEKLGEKISHSAYKIDEYVFIPASRDITDNINFSRSMYMDNNYGILAYFCQKELSPFNDLHIYRLKNVNGEIKKYDKNMATDSAKQDFYENMKKLIEIGKCDSFEILNEKNWYMTQDGQRVYNISPHLAGYMTFSSKEKVLKMLFDKLFN